MDMRAVNARVIEQFRAGEPVQGMHRDRLLLLTTTGRRSGVERTAPMMFVGDGGDPMVIASNDGAPEDPAWYRNLVADPAVTVETPDGERWPGTAEVLAGDARERAWADLVAAVPMLAEHQQRAGRPIPLVVLHRAG